MTKTIEERAREYANEQVGGEYHQALRVQYGKNLMKDIKRLQPTSAR